MSTGAWHPYRYTADEFYPQAQGLVSGGACGVQTTMRRRTGLLSRRDLLRGAGLVLAGAGAARARQGCRRLVAIVLTGGADGLNIVVPHADRDYYARRPSIAVPRSGPGGVIDLDGRFGLHPALAPLEPLYLAGTLAIVHACGLTGQPPSHLEAQDALLSALESSRLACSAIGEQATGTAAEVTAIRMPGWDHHANEGGGDGSLASKLDELARCIMAMVTDPDRTMSDTVLVVLSEFGRSVAENGRGGTDHGQGGAILVIGDHVRGGRVHGSWPGLADHQLADGTSLQITTDVRDVLGEIAAVHLGVTVTSVSRRRPHPGIMRRAAPAWRGQT